MTKEEFINWAKSKGWTKDKFGHLQKTINDKEYRFKIGSISVRYEGKLNYKSSGKEIGQYSTWIRIRSGYFKDLSINSESKLVGLK